VAPAAGNLEFLTALFIGTETLVTQLENERSRIHATGQIDMCAAD
jgi:hypothetical protein